MSIRKYTNFDSINSNSTNEGQFLVAEDLFIVTKNQTEEAEFGECKYDVMEVSVYDINKLLNDLGFTNGILKVNINFVRSRIGSENELERVWIHEISPSRAELRIIPLKTNSPEINATNTKQFLNLNNLNRDFKYYKKNILDGLDSFERTSLQSIDDALTAKFGNDFQSVLKKDFGLSNFNAFKTKIFTDFRDSVNYWLNNKNYDIAQSTFGSPSEKRFDDCEQYDFNYLLNEIKNILNNSITFNIKTLSRRVVKYEKLPIEFGVEEVKKEIQNLVEAYDTKVEIVRNVYSPELVAVSFEGISNVTPPTPVEVIPPQPPALQPPPKIPVVEEKAPVTMPEPVFEPPVVTTGGGTGEQTVTMGEGTVDVFTPGEISFRDEAAGLVTTKRPRGAIK